MSRSASRWRLPVGCMVLGGAVILIGWSGQADETSMKEDVDDRTLARADSAPSVPAPEPEIILDGASLYAEHCATCHMGDGSGVPNFQPPIAGSPVVAAGRDRLEAVIRAGSAALQDRPNTMGWQMPPFGYLTDPEVKALVGYVSEAFGPATNE